MAKIISSEVFLEKGVNFYIIPKEQVIIFISDIHLGAISSQPSLVVQIITKFLSSYPGLLVINVGDLYNGPNPQLRPDEVVLVSLLKRLAENGQLINIRGDHDNWLESFSEEAFNLPVYDEYFWKIESKQYVAVHGHQNDDFYQNNKKLATVLLGVYYFFQAAAKMELSYFGTHFIYKGIEWAKKVKNWWPSWSKRSALNLLKGYSFYGIDVLIAGHLHLPLRLRRRVKCKWFRYICTGGSNDLPFRYLILKNNRVKRKIFWGNKKKDEI